MPRPRQAARPPDAASQHAATPDSVSADLLLIVETASGPIVVLDRALRCVYVNAAASQLGAERARPDAGTPLADWLGDDEFAAALLRLVSDVIETGAERRIELMRGDAWFSAHGMITGTRVVLRLVDITARHRERAALLESEWRYRTLFEANPLPTFIWDVDTLAFVDVNRAAVEEYGWTREEFLGGMRLTDIRPPSQQALFRERLERIRNGVTGRAVYQHQRKDGSVFDAQIVAQSLDAGGRRLRVVTARDVTGERRAQATASQLAAIVRASNDAIVGTDAEGRVTTWNDAAEQIYGWTEQEIVGRPATELVTADAVDDYLRQRLRVVRDGESFHGVVPSRHRDGRRMEVALSLAPMRDETGVVVGMAGIARDITQQRLLERELQQAQKMDAVGRLAGGVAHDFNNMLTVIKANAELMRDDLPPGTETRAALDEIQRAALRAAALTRQLLAFSRQQKLETTVLDLNDVVAEVERMLSRLIGEDIDLTSRVQPRPARVRADRGQLEQVIVNLAINARDAMPDGGELFLGTSETEIGPDAARRDSGARAPGRYVVLTVRDSGTGMDDATKARIFEPFFTTKERGKGTGLGLAMVVGVVEQSGGFITVDSAPGRGTTFRVYMPAASDVEAAPTSGVEQSAAPAVAGTVLLTEDDTAVRTITRTMLRRHGYAVLEATNGREALAVLDTNGDVIDLVVTDAMMPQMTGPELAREVEARAPGMPVLFISGYTEDDLLRGDGGTVSAFLAKPFTAQQLCNAVDGLIARGQRARR